MKKSLKYLLHKQLVISIAIGMSLVSHQQCHTYEPLDSLNALYSNIESQNGVPSHSDDLAQVTLPAAGVNPPNVEAAALNAAAQAAEKTILINFNNVNIIEFIRFISRVSNKNFVFDESDLQFNVTIVSEEPTTIENILSALLQELRIHGLTMFDQGNNIIIHKNPLVNAISSIVADGEPLTPETEIVTQLIRLNTIDPDKVAPIIKPLISDRAIIEVFKETNHIIITDIATNIQQVVTLLKNLDSPQNGLVIAQYLVRKGFIDSLIALAQQIMRPIAQDQTLIFVPHRAINSIFVVSTPFLTERTLAILQYLDQNQGLTRIFDLKDLKFTPERYGAAHITGEANAPPGQGQWQLDENGNWIFRPVQRAGARPGVPTVGGGVPLGVSGLPGAGGLPGAAGGPGIPLGGAQPPEGNWYVDENGNWHFQIGQHAPTPPGTAGVSGPQGQWRLDSNGIWVFQLAPGQSISPERLVRPEQALAELPVGHIERTQFSLYKLQFRRGDQVQTALGKVGISLSQSGNTNADLIQAIESVQWIESSNALIISGTPDAIAKVVALIEEVDTPLRQVFIEMLILQTTVTDSLTYGVDFATSSGGQNTSTAQAFLSTGSPLSIAMATLGIGLTPDASSLATSPGFHQGIVGRRLTHGGTQFSGLGALVTAIHNQDDVNIIMNPKIIAEDNVTAQIFVGINTPFPTQAITNDRGNIITQNFDFRDVGTTLTVTPLIGDNDIITLTIEEQVSSISTVSTANVVGQAPTTNRNYTKTKVHLPDGFFLIISGMMQDQYELAKEHVPCLGGIPFLGAVASHRLNSDTKLNLLIFIRPKIIDTDEEINNLTKHQQDIIKYKNKLKTMWKFEVDEAMQFFNVPGCDECCDDDTANAHDNEYDCDCTQYAH